MPCGMCDRIRRLWSLWRLERRFRLLRSKKQTPVAENASVDAEDSAAIDAILNAVLRDPGVSALLQAIEENEVARYGDDSVDATQKRDAQEDDDPGVPAPTTATHAVG